MLPNRKAHWKAKREAFVTAKQLAWATALEAVMRIPGWRPISSCVVQYTFYGPDHRLRDPDNYAAACKPYLDGLVAAGLLLDDSNRVIKNSSGRFGQPDDKGPRTEVEITEVP
jgi:Holliday junction resolvase RusA-like endonuclease